MFQSYDNHCIFSQLHIAIMMKNGSRKYLFHCIIVVSRPLLRTIFSNNIIYIHLFILSAHAAATNKLLRTFSSDCSSSSSIQIKMKIQQPNIKVSLLYIDWFVLEFITFWFLLHDQRCAEEDLIGTKFPRNFSTLVTNTSTKLGQISTQIVQNY